MEEPLSEAEEAALRALARLILESKGTCVTFTSKKLAEIAGLKPKSSTLIIIKMLLNRLRRLRLIAKLHRMKGKKYMVTKDSPLWMICKDAGRERAPIVFPSIVARCLASGVISKDGERPSN